jgi:hypothetical protein
MKKNPAAVALGKLGGKAKSEAKARSSAANGAKGGRPRTKKIDAGGRVEYAYKFALIAKEENGVGPGKTNWACFIDGSRRNFPTLTAAKQHVDRVDAGTDHQGLR